MATRSLREAINMKKGILVLIVVSLCTAVGLIAQQLDKPQIGSITVLPSDPILPSGNCKVSRAGYLEKKGKIEMTKAEIGEFVDSSLRDGYVLTIYPQTKNGIFVNMECVAISRAQ